MSTVPENLAGAILRWHGLDKQGNRTEGKRYRLSREGGEKYFFRREDGDGLSKRYTRAEIVELVNRGRISFEVSQ
jgi:hypothetical protein